MKILQLTALCCTIIISSTTAMYTAHDIKAINAQKHEWRNNAKKESHQKQVNRKKLAKHYGYHFTPKKTVHTTKPLSMTTNQHNNSPR